MNAIPSTELNEAIRRGLEALNSLLRSKREQLRAALKACFAGQPVPKQEMDQIHADIAGAQAALRNL